MHRVINFKFVCASLSLTLGLAEILLHFYCSVPSTLFEVIVCANMGEESSRTCRSVYWPNLSCGVDGVRWV